MYACMYDTCAHVCTYDPPKHAKLYTATANTTLPTTTASSLGASIVFLCVRHFLFNLAAKARPQAPSPILATAFWLQFLVGALDCTGQLN